MERDRDGPVGSVVGDVRTAGESGRVWWGLCDVRVSLSLSLFLSLSRFRRAGVDLKKDCGISGFAHEGPTNCLKPESKAIGTHQRKENDSDRHSRLHRYAADNAHDFFIRFRNNCLFRATVRSRAAGG